MAEPIRGCCRQTCCLPQSIGNLSQSTGLWVDYVDFYRRSTIGSLGFVSPPRQLWSGLTPSTLGNSQFLCFSCVETTSQNSCISHEHADWSNRNGRCRCAAAGQWRSKSDRRNSSKRCDIMMSLATLLPTRLPAGRQRRAGRIKDKALAVPNSIAGFFPATTATPPINRSP